MRVTSRTFVDSNIITYVVTQHPKHAIRCLMLLEEIEHGERVGFISPLVIDEVAYILMIQKAKELTGITDIKAIKNAMPGLWDDILGPVNELYGYLDQMISTGGMKVLSLDYSVSRMALQCMKRYGLLPRDAMHTACCRAYGIEEIATNDSDFERVDGLKIWRP